MSQRKLVFSTPATAFTAANLAGLPHWEGRFERGHIDWKQFDDGTPKLMIRDIDDVNNRDVIFLAAFEQQEDYFTQFSAMYEIALAGPATFTIVLPYFPTATMERPVPHGTVVTAKTLAAMLECIPPARQGITELVVFDPHTEVLKSFFNPHKVRVTFTSFMPYIANMLKRHMGCSDWTVVFPDKGALERFGRFFPDNCQVACSKVRDGNGRTVSIEERYTRLIHGRNCIVVDDLMQSGGTLIQCAAALREMGAVKVECAFTHAVCPNESWKKLTPNVFDLVHTTNSCPSVGNRLGTELPNFSSTDMSTFIVDAL
ncbi:MAG: ribose-phosphate diphosphokinase [Candidatus Uhrbacteria bacterium]|nr:ribose-phosphate diphosphokinase [Candidatus Uhrbacteria bacterium]